MKEFAANPGKDLPKRELVEPSEEIHQLDSQLDLLVNEIRKRDIELNRINEGLEKKVEERTKGVTRSSENVGGRG